MADKTRGRPARTWVRLDCQGILHGSINWQLTLEEQAIWIKLFTLSAVCGGQSGKIQDNDGRPLPHEYIAHECHCSVDLLETTLDKCKVEGRLSENSDGIAITNFQHYQFTEYDRQKPYRQAKERQGKKVNKVCPACGYKAITDESECPRCAAKGDTSYLNKNYKAGRYGPMVQDGSEEEEK